MRIWQDMFFNNTDAVCFYNAIIQIDKTMLQ